MPHISPRTVHFHACMHSSSSECIEIRSWGGGYIATRAVSAFAIKESLWFDQWEGANGALGRFKRCGCVCGVSEDGRRRRPLQSWTRSSVSPAHPSRRPLTSPPFSSGVIESGRAGVTNLSLDRSLAQGTWWFERSVRPVFHSWTGNSYFPLR